MLVTKADGTTQEFDPHKLVRSLTRAGAKKEEVQTVLAQIESSMVPGLTTHTIFEHAFEILRTLGKPVASRYSLRRAIMGLGPTGFPFEDFVERIFQAEGYTTKVRQNIRGECALHEIDVIGYKADASFIAEAKFHKQVGYKSDLQVALYSYARFLDLHDFKVSPEANCPPASLKIITNTKFTTAAQEYSACKGIQLHSWGYPEGEQSLEALIEKNRIFPITALTSLTEHQKALLMQRGIVLCSEILEKAEVLEAYHIPRTVIDKVVEEVKMLIALQ